MANKNLEIITLGGGCFWCIEAILNEVKGVEKVISGYSGGTVPGIPTYREVCSGLTGHAEVVTATYDSDVILFKDLLYIFMMNHDPTTSIDPNQAYGSQYRSVIFYHNELQKKISQELILEVSSHFESQITTEISPAEKFHIAEAYHQDYYSNNGEAAYCKAIITPKLTKLRNKHRDKLKNTEKLVADVS